MAIRDTAGITRRNLLRVARTPQLVVFSVVSPIMFIVLFRYVLGGAIRTPGGNYVEYLLPGIFVQTALFGGSSTSVGLAEDLKGGIIDRFRTLPTARSAVLAARTSADLIRSAMTMAVMVGAGMAVGFRFHSTPARAAAGLGLVLLFGYAFSWVFAALGLAVRDPETAAVAGTFPLFPLVFASSALVPISTMPRWLAGFADVQPVTVTVDAVRNLLEGGPVWHWLWQSLLWSALILAVFVPLSVRTYRRA